MVSQYTRILSWAEGLRRGLDSLLALPWAYLNRLLQYLHGRVLGFCCLPSAMSSALPEMVAVSTD